jgi:hypothetical protein
MTCEHQWRRVLSFMCPHEQQRRYECQTCGLQIECFEGPIKEIEAKLKEKNNG